MECIPHFSHEHPLKFFQVGDFEDPKPYKCCICGLPILSSPSYCCSIDANCNFFVHKPCAQLPRELYYVGHRDTLYLERPTSSHSHFYKCKNYSECKFDLHPLIAKPVEIKSKHISHTSHPLVACCREIVCHCDGCGEEQKGFFFYCQECNFWIHQDCAILPTLVKLLNDPHPYILSYSPPFDLVGLTCSICSGSWRLSYNGVYLNAETYDTVHVTCAKSNMGNLPTVTMKEFILELPDEEDTFQSSVIRRSAERNPSTLKYHKHPLDLQHRSNRAAASGDDLVDLCDVCIKPIDVSSPLYRCQSNGCHFVAHDICANHLPSSLQLFIGGVLQKDVVPIQESVSNKICFSSVFPCFFCFRPCNGFVYGISDEDAGMWGYCDVECVLAPKIIKHASHRQHLLLQLTNALSNTSMQLSCCSGESFLFDVYTCSICDFSIHIRCALLPKMTRHKFDEHPLELIMAHDNNEGKKKELIYCEVCEQAIKLKLWYYGCHKCEQYFHIDCIPSVGYLSKVKFGKTHVDYKLHEHPLTLTRMLTHATHERCGVCNGIIEGFAHDQMAFQCSDCDFWIHFSCAYPTATTGLIDYSEYLISFQQACREKKETLQ